MIIGLFKRTDKGLCAIEYDIADKTKKVKDLLIDFNADIEKWKKDKKKNTDDKINPFTLKQKINGQGRC